MRKPQRYVVIHSHSWNGFTETASASYNTALDRALEYAKITANRYRGEIFEEYGDGILIPLRVK